MPYKNKKDRNYRVEYDTYQGTPLQKKRRAERNAARAEEEKLGKAHKGDHKDIDHIKMISKGGSNKLSNLRVRSEHANRSFDRNKNHSAKKNGW